ncbi:MAG: YbaB/EbfC family nucleoid-associated protein [Actinomycetota bacterium]
MSKDLQRMMKQAQKMAAEMQRAQEELAQETFAGSAGGGAVKVTVSGDQQIERVEIDPDIFEGAPDQDDIEMLADAVTAAANEALEKARAAHAAALGPLAGGLGGIGLPGS